MGEPTWLCVLIAAIEGFLATAAFLVPAVFYHVVLLDGPEGIAWHLYAIFAVLFGFLYAFFAGHAAMRFFAGERQLVTTLPATIFGWTASFSAMLMVAFLSGKVGDLSRVSLTAAYLLGIPFAIGIRGLMQSVMSRRIAGGALRFQKIAVLGERTSILAFLLANDLWRHGQSITGTLYLEDIVKDGTLIPGEVETFAATALRRGAHYIVITGDIAQIPMMNQVVEELKRFSVNVVLALDANLQRLHFLDVVPIGNSNTLRVLRQPLSAISVLLKRALDIAGASAGLVLLSPVFLAIAIAIKLDSPGPVFYRQLRRGFNGEPFNILKFRSMTVLEPATAMRQAERGDSRITRVGRYLRASSLDELPQLITVLSGQMSLVGPRPHAISHDDQLGRQMANYAHRQRIKPGITGWAQINGFRGETVTLEQMQGRTLHDLHYIENWSIFLDMWILLMTVLSPATHRNAF
ncbi:MAG: exopolysaccharide biosynthesis polyprenyl glycosylphosphotransferase [Flavobacteriaceae bacterium]